MRNKVKMSVTIAANVYNNIGEMPDALAMHAFDMQAGDLDILAYYPGATVADLQAAGAILANLLAGALPSMEMAREMERLAVARKALA